MRRKTPQPRLPTSLTFGLGVGGQWKLCVIEFIEIWKMHFFEKGSNPQRLLWCIPGLWIWCLRTLHKTKMLILLRKYWNTKASHQPIFSLSQTVDGGWPLPLAPDRGQKKGQKTRAEKRGKRPASRSPRGFQRRGEVAEPPDGRGLGLWETLNKQIKS